MTTASKGAAGFAKAILQHREDRGCHKIALALADGVRIETAFHHPDWLCVSTQAGCPLACTFCETGAHGLRRNLTAEEILLQCDQARSLSRREDGEGPRDFRTISFSGMGEPLLNFPALAQAMRHLHRHTTSTLHVSTLGILPRLPDLFALDLPFALDISLHATTDAARTRLIPINARYPLDRVLDAVFDLNRERHALVTICYMLLDGVNDSVEDLQRLMTLLRGQEAVVELKRYNPVSEEGLRASPPDRFVMFRAGLQAAAIPAYVFGNEGLDIKAGCGQLVWSVDAGSAEARRT